jgi:hypothetical protein
MMMMKIIVSEIKNKNKRTNLQMKKNNNNYNSYDPASNKYSEEFIEF